MEIPKTRQYQISEDELYGIDDSKAEFEFEIHSLILIYTCTHSQRSTYF